MFLSVFVLLCSCVSEFVCLIRVVTHFFLVFLMFLLLLLLPTLRYNRLTQHPKSTLWCNLWTQPSFPTDEDVTYIFPSKHCKCYHILTCWSSGAIQLVKPCTWKPSFHNILHTLKGVGCCRGGHHQDDLGDPVAVRRSCKFSLVSTVAVEVHINVPGTLEFPI